MPIKFSCPHCKSVMSVPDSLAGKSGKCSKCKGVVKVPLADGAPAEAPAAAPSPAADGPGSPPPVADAPGSPVRAPGSPTPVAHAPGSPAAPAKPPAKAPGPRLAPERPAPSAKAAPAPGPATPHVAPPEPAPSPAATTVTPAEMPTETAPPHTTAGNGEAPPDHAGRSLADIEAEAAAALADAPKPQEAEVEPKTIDFECPQCGEMLHLPLDLAGKRHPCPECRRIIKVPDLQQKQKKDWRPEGARAPTEPAPEGAWGSVHRTGPSEETLRGVGLIKERERPLTFGQKYGLYITVATTLVVLLSAGWFAWGWWAARREERALRAALAYAGSDKAPKEVGAAGVAALYAGAGRYAARAGGTGSATKASEHFAKAVSVALRTRGSGRDALLGEIARDFVDLGGEGPEVRDGARLAWNDVQKNVRAALAAISSRAARVEALAAVSRALIEQGQPQRVLPLAVQASGSTPADQAEGVARAGLELSAAGKKDEAGKALDQAAALYKDKNEKDRPVMQPSVVALAGVLGRKPPEGQKGLETEENTLVGEAEAQAVRGEWADAEATAGKGRSTDVRCRALAAIAEQAVRAKAPDAKAALERALAAAEQDTDRKDLPWVLFRLVRLAARADLPDVAQRGATLIPERGLRGWAQLLVLRARLSSSRGVVDQNMLDSVEPDTLAAREARLELARHNARADSGWARTVDGWPEPLRAFGQMGVALGLQKG